MTEPANGVRAVATVGVPPRRPAGPATLKPLRRSGQLGPVHVLQVICVEALVVGALALTGQALWVSIVAGVLAAALIFGALARQHERWWVEHWALTWRYRRRAAAKAPNLPDDQLADLHLFAPGLTITDVGGPAGDDPGEAEPPLHSESDDEPATRAPAAGDSTVVAVARDEAGWYAAARVRPGAAMIDDPAATVPLPQLVRALGATSQAGVLLQVVSQGAAAPEDGDPETPAARSYRELTAAVGPAAVAPERACWLVVRLDEHLLASAGVGADAADRAPAVVAALLRLAARSTRRAGLHVEPLDRAALLAALLDSCGLVGSPGAPAPHEEWHAWSAGELSYVSYWIRDWPAPSAVPALLRGLESVPAAQTTVAMVVAVPPVPDDGATDPPPDDAEVRCLIRVGAPAERADEVHAAVLRCAEEHATGLHRLDGEHGPAVYATAPTGGGAW